MTGTVQAAREALGVRLRDLRRDARLSGRELAALTGWHFTKVSKIEHGRTMPTEADLELWCFHCRAQNELPDLTATVRSIEKMYSEIKRLMRTGTARYQREVLEEYRRSRRFREFQTALVPGPLQTRDYASAILADAAAMLGHPADIEPTVLRPAGARQAHASGDRLFHFVAAGERAEHPRRAAGGHARAASAPAGRAPLAGCEPGYPAREQPVSTCRCAASSCVDDRDVEVETFSAIVRVTQPHEIAVYAKVFDHYARLAVYHDEARAMVVRATSLFGQSGATA